MTVLLKLSQVWENCFIQHLNIVELADIYNGDFFSIKFQSIWFKKIEILPMNNKI